MYTALAIEHLDLVRRIVANHEGTLKMEDAEPGRPYYYDTADANISL